MFIAGVKHLDRVRGSGWLDCPSCHEHALQDVIDDMAFLALLVYRFTPVSRTRYLVCRHCGYKRPATDAEMRTLDSAGTPIRRAWLAPIGAIGAIVTYLFVFIFIASSQDVLSQQGITFVGKGGGKVAPDVHWEVPQSWNYDLNVDSTPPFILSNDTSGQSLSIYLVRDPSSHTMKALVTNNYLEPTGLADNNTPSSPPSGSCSTVAGLGAYYGTYSYRHQDRPAKAIVYAFFHDGVGYLLIFAGATDEGIKTIAAVADHVVKTVKFTGTETPAPVSPTASVAATPTPSPSPGGSPSPTPAYNCGGGASPSPK